MKLDDFYKIESQDNFESKKAFFRSIEIPDISLVKHSTIFIDYLKTFPLYSNESEYNLFLQKCNFTPQEIQHYDLKLPLKTRRVSWDDNLLSIQEIEGRKLKKTKNLNVLYEFDIKKIQECDKEKVLEVINSLQKNKYL